MRIEQLSLARYGKFTDQTLDFGPPRPGKPDLHIVLGANEAGKTTTLNAWLDLLYGMGQTNAFAFLHGYDSMRVGARIGTTDGVRDYVRVKSRKSSLLDASGAPVAEDGLLAPMNGLGRTAYANMFSMDSRALEEGGREALESKGHLGEMLYSASAGLGAISGVIAQLHAKADQFWKKGSRKSELSELKQQLVTLRERRADIDTTEAVYSRHKKELETSQSSYQAAVTRVGKLEQRAKMVSDLLSALVVAPKLANARLQLTTVPAFAAAPADWSRRAGELRVADAETRTRLQALREKENDLARKLAALPLDAAALSLANELEQARLLQSRHATAAVDIPRLQHDLELGERQLVDLLRQLDQAPDTDANTLLLPAHVMQGLRDLIERQGVLDTQLRDATREHGEAVAALAELSPKGEDASPEAMDESQIAAVGARADTIRDEGFDRRISAAQRALEQAGEVLSQRMQVLAPWEGDAAELAALVMPAASAVDGLAHELTDAIRQRDALAQTLATAQDDLHRLAAELAALAAVTGDADDTGHVRARGQREQAWATHRTAMSTETADAFEAAMRHDDTVADTRLTRQRELAQAGQLRQEQARRAQQAEQLQAQMRASDAAIASVRARTSALAARMSPLLAGMDAPDDLAGWLLRRAAALDARQPVLEAGHALATVRALQAEAIDALRALLAGRVPTSADLTELLNTAHRLREAALQQRQRQQGVARAASNAEQRKRTLARVKEDVAAWDARWRDMCTNCWLGRGQNITTDTAKDIPLASLETARVRAALDLLGPLEKALSQRHDLATRIAKMTRDQNLFTDAVTGLARRADPDGFATASVPPTEALHWFRRLETRIASASDSERRRQELQEELEHQQQDLQQVAKARSQLQTEVGQMAAHFGVETIVEIQNALEACDRRDSLGAQIDDLEQQVLIHTGAATTGDADRLLADADHGALIAEQAEIREELNATRLLMQQLFADQSKAQQALAAIGPDAAVAQLDAQRQTVLLDAAEKTRAWLRLRLGIYAAEQGLSVWREQHRSALLRHASNAFSHMSCGAWAGLEAQHGAQGEMLMAVDHARVARKVEHLSKGARFQLYLALRIAAYQDFAEARTPPPFVADDIMETFDDDRAGATFDLLAGMAGKGQVIYLTHHQHLCDIAQARCPDAMIHTLPA